MAKMPAPIQLPLSPQDIIDYNSASPGLGTALAESLRSTIDANIEENRLRTQREHDRFLAEVNLRKRAQWFVFSIFSLMVAVVVFAISMHAELTASVIGGSTMIGLATVYFKSLQQKV